MGFDEFAPIEPGSYFIDPDLDPSTPLRVTYEVPSEGWSQWTGAIKVSGDNSHAGVAITTVANLVSDACLDHSYADPPLGPSVDDLASGLAQLTPFEVTSRPKDVTVDGFSGKHLELTVPDAGFADCVDGNLNTWVGALEWGDGKGTDSWHGYTGPGYREEFWILDVEGTRLMIAAERSPDSPPGDLDELQAILDSIRIEPSPAPTEQDVMELAEFAPLDPGTYFIDPDLDPSNTPLRVTYEVPSEGWNQWTGAVKWDDVAKRLDAVGITTVTNLVREGCQDHSYADPPVGPSVDDLASGLTELAPFEVTSAPKDVTVDGYSGKHLELTVPKDMPMGHEGFLGCTGGNLASWVGAFDAVHDTGGAFGGYTHPGDREEFWILDVEGTRLVIAAERAQGSPSRDLAELQDILDSIRIEA
jgi:hypothetical protein